VLGYYLRLALKSLRRTPGLSALMVCAIALGIAACIVTLTFYHAMSGNPIWWKNNVLYAVTMDSWDLGPPPDPEHPTLAPPQLNYKDATYLLRSDIPKRKLITANMLGMLNGAPGQTVPMQVMTRATTKDFFAMFDVPFEYGGGWRGSDFDAVPEIVLTKEVNDRLFGGANSVGRFSSTATAFASWGSCATGIRCRGSTTSSMGPSRRRRRWTRPSCRSPGCPRCRRAR
jgi:putative ABC transport system permease protein